MTDLEKIRAKIDNALPGARFLSTTLADDAPSGDAPDEQNNTRRHKLLMTGEWKGHWQGAFVVTKDDLKRIVANAKGQQTDIPVDYEHGTVFALFGGDTKAAGWLDPKSLAVEDTDNGAELFGTIDWTQPAAAAIRNREYRYKSPTIQWRTTDRKTGVDMGTSLHSVALTNTPFLEELPEVSLNSLASALSGPLPKIKQESETMDPKQQAAIALSLGLSEHASPEDILSACRNQAEDAQGIEQICTALELESGTDVKGIVSAVADLRANSVSAEELTALRTDAEEGRKVRIDAVVEAAAKDGKIAASNRDWALSWASKDLAAFTSWCEGAPKAVPTGSKKPGQAQAASIGEIDAGNPTDDQVKQLVSAMSDFHKSTAQQFGLSAEAYARVNADRILAELNG